MGNDSDDETSTATGKLNSREEFPGWKSRMMLAAMHKGDTDGIFTDRGNNPVIGYQSYPVGAGGNAGNQAAVRIIRGLATGEVTPDASPATRAIVSDEFLRAAALACILVAAGFVRVIAFDATVADAAAISASLFLIVSTSVVLGTILPLVLQSLRVDAAHASTTIQVIMDVMGVLITCTVAPKIYFALAPILAG